MQKDDVFRIKSGIKFTLSYFAAEGSTFLPRRLLCEKTGELLDIDMESIEDAITEMAFEGDVHVENLDGRVVVFLMVYYMAEQNVCKSLASLSSAPLKPIKGIVESLISRTENATGIYLSENQKNAVVKSLDSGVSVITGGPGTGKTTIINTIINILEESGLKTAIAAPTGRAAKRITETSGHDASTIHRLLEYYFSEDENIMRFGRTKEDPLDYDAVIVDEASMIDIMLMNGLVSAIRPGTRFIVVGDADQLPSVGAGNVLRDMIDSEYIYCTKLTEIFRQAKESMIVVNAHRINKGEYPECNVKDKDFFMLQRSSEKGNAGGHKGTVYIEASAILQRYIAFCRYTDSDTGQKGTLGQCEFEPSASGHNKLPSPDLEEKSFGDRILREGDKVMQIKNNYQLSWKNAKILRKAKGYSTETSVSYRV